MKKSLGFGPFIIFFLMSCGQEMKAKKNSQNSLLITEGNYRARIIPMNRQFQKTSLTGEVISKIDSIKMNIQVDLRDLSPSMLHPHYIHYGSNCPTESDDLNSDGLIDVSEAQKAMGPEFITLEGHDKIVSSSQFPQANSEGELFYLKSISIDEMKNYFMNSDFKKWPGQAYSFSQMSYLILGINEDVEVPETVRGIPGLKKQTSIPVGCGIFEKMQIETSSSEVNGGKN